jgi:CBS domain-containing protein
MTQKRIRHLPVMQDGVLIGIVSIGDVVKAQLHHFEGEALTLRQYITGGLL